MVLHNIRQKDKVSHLVHKENDVIQSLTFDYHKFNYKGESKNVVWHIVIFSQCPIDSQQLNIALNIITNFFLAKQHDKKLASAS